MGSLSLIPAAPKSAPALNFHFQFIQKHFGGVSLPRRFCVTFTISAQNTSLLKTASQGLSQLQLQVIHDPLPSHQGSYQLCLDHLKLSQSRDSLNSVVNALQAHNTLHGGVGQKLSIPRDFPALSKSHLHYTNTTRGSAIFVFTIQSWEIIVIFLTNLSTKLKSNYLCN